MVLAITVSGEAFADSDDMPMDVKFIGSNVVNFDQGQTTVVLKVVVSNYDPGGGYFYSKIIDPNGKVVSDSEIFLKYWKNGLWHVTVGYSVDKYDYRNQFNILGNWSITIYNEAKSVSESVQFSVVGQEFLVVRESVDSTYDEKQNDDSENTKQYDSDSSEKKSDTNYWWKNIDSDSSDKKSEGYWWDNIYSDSSEKKSDTNYWWKNIDSDSSDKLVEGEEPLWITWD